MLAFHIIMVYNFVCVACVDVWGCWYTRL